MLLIFKDGVVIPLRKISEIQAELGVLQSLPFSPDHVARHKCLLKTLEATFLKEEMFWHQSSRVNWLKYGDQNTRFFHLSAIQRG